MNEELLGYLLGAMEPDERTAFERRLEADLDLREQLTALRRVLAQNSSNGPALDPPAGLARRTTEFVAHVRAQEAARFFFAKGAATGEAASATRRAAAPDAASPYAMAMMDGGADQRSRWRLTDYAALGGIALAASLLLFPALASWRYQHHVVACQERLHRLGVALVDYSRTHGDLFPEVPQSGPLAHAGVYAPRLLAAGLIHDAADVICPGSSRSFDDVRLPRLDELQRSDPAQEAAFAASMGGGYGYALGYVDDAGYHPLRNRNRSTFAILADEPNSCSLGSLNHGCGGQNVLFEDGHAEFLSRCKLKARGDEIFRNAAGFVGAGIGPDDVVIGSSAARPLLSPPQ